MPQCSIHLAHPLFSIATDLNIVRVQFQSCSSISDGESKRLEFDLGLLRAN